MVMDTVLCKAMLMHVAKNIQENIELLNEADGLGDSDHGTGMGIGFKAVAMKLSTGEFPDLGSLFKAVGMAIMMSAGGASGALFGSFFKDGSKALDGIEVLDSSHFAQFLHLGLDSVVHRGKAAQGDKTMVDALIPALECAIIHSGQPIQEVIHLCALQAKKGSEATRDMVAKLGRMQTLGQRSIGYVDPGSITMALIFISMDEFLSKQQP